MNIAANSGSQQLGAHAPHGEIFIGPALSGTQPHDHPAAWNALVRGRKRWFIWPKLCRAPAGAEGGAMFGVTVVQWIKSVLPTLRGPCAPTSFEQVAGEVVFVPYGWPHAVLNIEPSIGVR